MPTQLGAASVAGFTAAFFSLPFDLLKSRLQDGSKYKGIVDAAAQIVRKVSHIKEYYYYIATYLIYIHLNNFIGRFFCILDRFWSILWSLRTSFYDYSSFYRKNY